MVSTEKVIDLTPEPGRLRTLVGRMQLADPKTDLFLGANALDAVLTYLALAPGGSTDLMEFNSILYALMTTFGVGYALLFKVVLCVGILWFLRKIKKEKLLVPLSAVFIVIALVNLIVRLCHNARP